MTVVELKDVTSMFKPILTFWGREWNRVNPLRKIKWWVITDIECFFLNHIASHIPEVCHLL